MYRSMFTDVDVATVIRTVAREGRPGHAYQSAVASGMPDAVYAEAIQYARRTGLIIARGQMIRTTHKGRRYASHVEHTATWTRVIARGERRDASRINFAATSDDFDGPLARTPGSSSSGSGATL